MLNITNLSMNYGKQQVLKNINLQIQPGLFGLLGPNGAGKSTLMKILASILQPQTGKVQFKQLDILQQPQQLRQQLGYMPQEFGGYPGVSAYRLLEHIAIVKGVSDKQQRKAQIDYLLNKTNLWQYRKLSTAKFSGGMKQRFGVAQALIGQPKLIIVDEPTAGLDPVERNRFYDLLSQQAEDKVVILSTHIVEDVAVLCDKMAILLQGEIVEHGQPKELLRQLDGHVFSKFTDDQQVLEINRQQDIISERRISGQKLIHIVAPQAVAGFTEEKPSLEDLYFCHINQGNFLKNKAKNSVQAEVNHD